MKQLISVRATRDKLFTESVGTQDVALLPRDLRVVADNLQAITVEGTGHWVAEERPVAATEALIKVLPTAPN